ncbi:hypothetical protein P168DRAFT_289207 [Aspergillus campestris IBT 28561]|uniref:Uncharacterized protein n=1 Tax=Aspergillus campestris (strain IBT 28561) TaxID=1392248 RepID=A0A2I1D7D8_ASPC2|nr:uncharacterized protein P168DRAFT_289207 [Aspergillus campestris IBT 28561]PKY05777.1 hypothetical protein P168DRAFT_289207 [Aspergillus campestris IBT 28561]
MQQSSRPANKPWLVPIPGTTGTAHSTCPPPSLGLSVVASLVSVVVKSQRLSILI